MGRQGPPNFRPAKDSGSRGLRRRRAGRQNRRALAKKPTAPTRVADFDSAILRVERERKTRIWSIIHLGPDAHFCHSTYGAVFKSRHDIGTGQRIDLLVHSGGGHPEVAYRIMRFFRHRFEEVNIIVPLFAKSAATLMCLGADTVFMGEMADLGPIDIQLHDQVKHGGKQFSPLDEFKSLEFMREQAIEWMDYYATIMNVKFGLSIREALKDSVPLVTGLLRPIFEQIDPIEMGGYRRNIAISEEYARRMLALTGNQNAEAIVDQTVWGYPAHDFCIDIEEAARLGIPVEPLPEAQEKAICNAIGALRKHGRDEHYGFTPQPVKKPKAVREIRPAPERAGDRAGEGRDTGQAKRLRA